MTDTTQTTNPSVDQMVEWLRKVRKDTFGDVDVAICIASKLRQCADDIEKQVKTTEEMDDEFGKYTKYWCSILSTDLNDERFKKDVLRRIGQWGERHGYL